MELYEKGLMSKFVPELNRERFPTSKKINYKG